MAKIFILPKREELAELKILKSDDNIIRSSDIHILFPYKVVVYHGGFPEILEMAQKVTKMIDQFSVGDKELYLLYHIGNALHIDTHLKAIIPHLNANMYSHTNANYEKIKILIKNVSENNVKQSTESIIKDFFFDKELEAKLELLHLCLIPSTIPDLQKFQKDFAVLNSYKDNYIDFLDAKECLKKEGTTKTYAAADNNMFDPQYLKILEQLRDNML